MGMMMSMAPMASAAYYLTQQRSYRHPNEYYSGGQEPDGVWFNPTGMFGLPDGGKIDSRDFLKLYDGYSPLDGSALIRSAGNPSHSPGHDFTFSVDKSVSVLWAIADAREREIIEEIVNEAARFAVEQTLVRMCSTTRVRRPGKDGEPGEIEVVPAELIGVQFQHGDSREGDAQLHIHFLVLNVAKTREDGKYRAVNMHPMYKWQKALGAAFGAYVAEAFGKRLGVRLEHYGENNEFLRVAGIPASQAEGWSRLCESMSKRRTAMLEMAREMGPGVEHNAGRMQKINLLTRGAHRHGDDPAVQRQRWRDWAAKYIDRTIVLAHVMGQALTVTDEDRASLEADLTALLSKLTRYEAVVRLPALVAGVFNLLGIRAGVSAFDEWMSRLVKRPEVMELTPHAGERNSPEGKAGMYHTRVFTTKATVDAERAVHALAQQRAAGGGARYALAGAAVEEEIERLRAAGYPLSGEQAEAIRWGAKGQVAIIEGAAGSGKTTILRPLADLYREAGYRIVPTAVAWKVAAALGTDTNAHPYAVETVLREAASGRLALDEKSVIIVDEAGTLPTRQMRALLALGDEYGAKLVFAGDTEQQQPVEAGPGLALVRDKAGSIRVDTIRRQHADLADVLHHVHGLSWERAQAQAQATSPAERERLLDEYAALDEKPAFKPWQVSASEAVRAGDAEAALSAYEVGGHFYPCAGGGEATLERMARDWAGYVRENPGKSALVTTVRKVDRDRLSELMLAHDRAAHPDAARAVVRVIDESQKKNGKPRTHALEVAVGDRLRIGALHWEKRLYRGTVVIVEGLEERSTLIEQVVGKALGRELEARLLIRGRTEAGDAVEFYHDEIRDYFGNVCLEHGYALTLTVAQGATVDQTFFHAEPWLTREQAYVGMTRHVEGCDMYLNRAAVAGEIAEQLSEADYDHAVSDQDIRDYVVELWSRTDPKEAALDYFPGERAETSEERKRKANDREQRLELEHGEAVKELGSEYRAIEKIQTRLRAQHQHVGDVVASTPDFTDMLSRQGELLKAAAVYRAQPWKFRGLLRKSAHLAQGDFTRLEFDYHRGRHHWRDMQARANLNHAPALDAAVGDAVTPGGYGSQPALALEETPARPASTAPGRRVQPQRAPAVDATARPATAAPSKQASPDRRAQPLAPETEAPPTARAELGLPGRPGAAWTEVEVIGETPKRIRIRALTDTRMPSRGRVLKAGETALVAAQALRPVHTGPGVAGAAPVPAEVLPAPSSASRRAPQRYPSAGELSSALAERAEAVCRRYLPDGTKNGAYWHAGSPAGEKGRSMYVHLSGALRGKWTDVATDTRGDLLDLIRLNQGLATLNAAKDEAVRFLGGGLAPVDPPSPAPGEPAPDTDNAARLARFFESASPLGEDDAAARYLVSRGLSPAHAQALRFHPRTYVKMGEETETHPALLAPIETPAGELEGLHRILLTPEGGPAPIAGHKRTSGALGAGGVWFGNPRAARVAVCEGVEDALTVLAALPPETHQRIGIVASMSAARIDKVALAPETRELVLLQDRDAAGERAWAALNARYAGSTVSVSRVLPTGGKDLNESLLALGPEALREQLAAFVPFTPAEQASNAFIAFRDDWNHFIKRAGEDGVHPFYQEGYSALTARRAPLSELPHQSTEAREALTKADHWHHEQHIAQRDIVRLIKALDSHDRNYGVLKSAADLGGYGVENTTAYPAWRERRNDLATEGEQRLAEPRYTHHLDNITGARERLEKVVAEHRERVRRIAQLSNEPSPDDPGHRPRRSRGISPV